VKSTVALWHAVMIGLTADPEPLHPLLAPNQFQVLACGWQWEYFFS